MRNIQRTRSVQIIFSPQDIETSLLSVPAPNGFLLTDFLELSSNINGSGSESQIAPRINAEEINRLRNNLLMRESNNFFDWMIINIIRQIDDIIEEASLEIENRSYRKKLLNLLNDSSYYKILRLNEAIRHLADLLRIGFLK
jgi:hypothetical protein